MSVQFTIHPYSEAEFERASGRLNGTFSAWSGKAGRSVYGRGYVSNFVDLADYDLDVTGLAPAPLRLRIGHGKAAFNFVPDFKVVRADGGAHLVHFVFADRPDPKRDAAIEASRAAGLKIVFVDVRFLSTPEVDAVGRMAHWATHWRYPPAFVRDARRMLASGRERLTALCDGLVEIGWPERGDLGSLVYAPKSQCFPGTEWRGTEWRDPTQPVTGAIAAALRAGDLGFDPARGFMPSTTIFPGPADPSARAFLGMAKDHVIASTLDDPAPSPPSAAF